MKKRVVSQSARHEKDGPASRSTDAMSLPDEERPLLDGGGSEGRDGERAPPAAPSDSRAGDSASWARRNQWIAFALASGACAAFNGVFAKL